MKNEKQLRLKHEICNSSRQEPIKGRLYVLSVKRQSFRWTASLVTGLGKGNNPTNKREERKIFSVEF